ncbi:MAG: DNA-protecting protein DprA [Chloroflexi bacterium]|nr:DNA-protecting protein DprA [Chloroflexota bacterium]
MVRGIGAARVRALLDYFGSLEEAWHAPAEELREAGLDRRSLANLLALRSRIDLDREMERLQRADVQVFTWEDEDYPRRLRQIYNPPPVLYVKGTLLPQDDWAIAIVGTRRPTNYGREAARMLGEGLARQGITVVSGLALGIDAEAHRAALDAGGRTIAVLGSGFRHLYPAQHKELARRIVQQGAVISEYALDVRPEASNFPPRNRIISGLSMGVVVVEAGEKSGALITAAFAAEQGREVFAVPGPIFHHPSKGTNRLIQEGAKAVTSVQDILEELDLTMVAEQQEARLTIPTSELEERILACLEEAPKHVDEVVQELGEETARVISTLTLLELKGLVRQVGPQQYRRVGG